MKKKVLWIFKMVLSGTIAIIVLSAFTFFYSYSGVHRPNLTGATDYTWGPDELFVNREEGDAVLRYDANGFNNLDWDPDRAIDVLMMGDSQMLATQVPTKESPAALLNQIYPDKYTYSVAMGSHSIYTCVKNMENALEEYKPGEYVLIDTSQLDLSGPSMQSVLDGTYENLPSYNGTLEKVLRKWVPGIKQVVKQIKNWTELGAETSQTSQDEPLSMTEYREILDEFLGKAARTASDHGVRLIILYIPKTEIQAGGGIKYLTDPDYLAAFTQVCDRNGIIFADMTGAYERLYSEQHRLPYGFTNTEVGEGHINKYGYQVIAEDLAQILRGTEEAA